MDKIRLISIVKLNIKIDDTEYISNFLVVSQENMDLDVVIGEEFCTEAEIRIDRNGLHYNKITSENNVASIHYGKDTKKKVFKLITNYKREKTKMTYIEMNIVLRDISPISLHPRRMPMSEREFDDNQIDL